MNTLKSIIWITQLGISIISPLVVCVLASIWLSGHYGIGSWIIVAGVFLGLGGSATSLWHGLKQMFSETGKDGEKHIGFNEHK